MGARTTSEIPMGSPLKLFALQACYREGCDRVNRAIENARGTVNRENRPIIDARLCI
jgi:hypothetical protein